MNSETAIKPIKKSGLSTVLAVLGIIVLIGAFFFAIQLLRGSSKASNAEAPRASVAATYAAITVPSSLKLLEHRSVSTGTPSEVYFYTISGDKMIASDQFAANLTKAGYSVIKGTDGLLFSASKAGNISLNFTFSEPNQLKVIAI